MINSLQLDRSDSLFIGGEWRAPSTDAMIKVISPTTQELVTQVAAADKADVDAAVEAARRAFDNGPWPRMKPQQRAEKIKALARAVERRADDLRDALTLQVGVPVMFSRWMSVMYPAMLDYVASLAETYPWTEVRPNQGGGICVLAREPVGVTVAIVPWNSPMSLLLLKVGWALMAGCTVIAKPSPETPLDALILAECAAEVGLPEGVLSVLPAGREVGDYLISRPEVDKVSFTGSTAAGKHIASVCGSRMARVTTELGGKSAAILLDDVDIGTMTPQLLPHITVMTGQQCAAFTRILAPRRRHDEIVDAISTAMQRVRVGDPRLEDTEMGPLIAERQRDRVTNYIESARSDGARLVCGGGRPQGLDRGWFVDATLLSGVDNSMRIAQEEVFGPVAVVIPYDTEEEAIAIANNSPYGLSGGVFTPDTERAYAIARRIRTGNFTQNGRIIDFTLPYGGFKESGVGREGGVEGLTAFTEQKSIFLPTLPSALT
jgi:aldehyde dehydrogenase (NAD+)